MPIGSWEKFEEMEDEFVGDGGEVDDPAWSGLTSVHVCLVQK